MTANHRSVAVIVVAVALFGLVLAACPAPADTPKIGDAGPEYRLTPTKSPTDKPPPADIPAPPDVAAPPADAEKTASGLASKVIKPGSGDDKPSAQDTVEVHYTGWTTDGRMFDSSVKRGRTTTFPLNGVIKGWTEGVPFMKVGETRRFWIPSELAYGDKPTRPGAPSGMLVFDIELVRILRVPPVPADLTKPPKDAVTTASGLVWRSVKKGTGTEHPAPTSVVEVHYAGWTKDGKMFDNSYKRGRTAKFPLSGVIKGWTEGVPLLTVGETGRFWIPAALAYGEEPMRPGAPAGDLVFDIELVAIDHK
ncbi:MAG: FKBP-type peptidyl-prolyl cis-trans isomerase [Deltaproteobacteria bacterium]|nr:FKBP-type peptidyl-prolyl cis-trans isomerase [Deltaproteobacteria bacterium]